MKRTKFGQFMYNITNSICCFITRHRWLYYLLNFTWGIPMVLFGFIVALILLLTGHKIYKRNKLLIFEAKIGSGWGLSLGVVKVVSKDCIDDARVCSHEFGHTVQNALYGPFDAFLIEIPSAIRFWYREIKIKHNKPLKTAYDDMWFEGSATYIGDYDYHNYRKKEANLYECKRKRTK